MDNSDSTNLHNDEGDDITEDIINTEALDLWYKNRDTRDIGLDLGDFNRPKILTEQIQLAHRQHNKVYVVEPYI